MYRDKGGWLRGCSDFKGFTIAKACNVSNLLVILFSRSLAAWLPNIDSTSAVTEVLLIVTNGAGSPDRGILCCCGACRRGMDNVGFRTLGGGERAMPSWARGRMNATVIMISQGAMALGGVIWGSAGAIAGASCTLLGAAVLFLTSLLLARRLSINFAGNPEERVSGVLARTVEPEAVTSIALTNELLAV